MCHVTDARVQPDRPVNEWLVEARGKCPGGTEVCCYKIILCHTRPTQRTYSLAQKHAHTHKHTLPSPHNVGRKLSPHHGFDWWHAACISSRSLTIFPPKQKLEPNKPCSSRFSLLPARSRAARSRVPITCTGRVRRPVEGGAEEHAFRSYVC